MPLASPATAEREADLSAAQRDPPEAASEAMRTAVTVTLRTEHSSDVGFQLSDGITE
ncbi:hypothetical protein QFZ67_007193 [Streptomyces sp. V1I1]|nr:hypothetical protein [Streptomyces sp. V1I1]